MKTFITLKKKNHNTTITWKITNQAEDQHFQKQKKYQLRIKNSWPFEVHRVAWTD